MAAHMPAAAAILASIAATAHCISALLLSREKKYRACAKNGWRCGRAGVRSAERRALSHKASFLLYVGD
jgi:copper oxidase (laccase) domain-containing protein